MAKRSAAFGVIFFLVATSAAFCQKQPVADLSQGLQADVSKSSEAQGEQTSAWRSLPDAPLPVRAAKEAEKIESVHEANSSLLLGKNNLDGMMRETELPHGAPGQLSVTTVDRTTPAERPSGFWGRYLYGPAPNHATMADSSTDGSFVGRVAYAASRIVLTQDEAGRNHLNTAYLFRVLTLAAIHASARPYWARSSTATFGDFGSAIGGGAGENVVHAFQPEIGQVVKKITPRFVSRIERRISGDVASRAADSIPKR